MKALSQSPCPQIQFFNYDSGSCYQTFSVNSLDISGKNLQSYSYDKSIDNMVGSFQIQVKEDTTVNKELFMDKIKHLDIVKISEDGINVDFIGIITTVSFGATASNTNKIISISGRSIEYLFELFMISGDVTAFSMFNSETSQLDLITALNSNKKEPIKLSDAVQTIYKVFTNIANSYPGISSTGINTIIKRYYGDAANWLKAGNLKFLYPISTNFISNGTMKLFQLIRNLLPTEVYEIYGYIDNGNPKVRIREVPFDAEDFSQLKETIVKPEWITDFTFTKSNDEVYTAFISYVEGSAESREFYKKVNATNSGYATADADAEMIALYGYRPKFVNFIGFGRQDDDSTQSSVDQNLANGLTSLNTRLLNWYSHLPDMYSGDVSIVNILSKTMPKIGERIRICNGSFYVTKEKHSWRYGSAPTINYTIERGGIYSSTGTFSKLEGISKPFSELIK